MDQHQSHLPLLFVLCSPWKLPPYQSILVETSKKGLLTLPGYLAMWSYTAAVDPKAALAGALYLGFPSDAPLERLLTVSKSRRQERRVPDAPRRSVLQGLVFAAKGVDATPILEGLITQARPTHGTPTQPISAAVAAVPLPAAAPPPGEAAEASNGGGGSAPSTPPANGGASPPSGAASAAAGMSTGGSAVLILEAVSEAQAHVLLESPTRADDLQRCDSAVFAFDGSKLESFRSAVEQMVAVASASGDTLPCLFVALHEGEMSPVLATEVEAACSALKVPMPLSFPPQASASGALAGAYRTIAQAALAPEGFIPETPSLRATKQYRRMLRRAALVAAGGTVGALAGYFAYKFYRQQQSVEGARAAGSGGGAERGPVE